MKLAETILEMYFEVNVDDIANKMGAKVNYTDTLDVFGRYDVINSQTVCWVNNTLPKTTQRMVLAHELGCYVLRYNGGYPITYQSFYTNHSGKEKAANDFALTLLMPKRAIDFLINDKGIYQVQDLAKLLDVSVTAIKCRLKQLGWLPK